MSDGNTAQFYNNFSTLESKILQNKAMTTESLIT